MTKTIEAIYEDGLLRPIQPLEGVADRSRVRLTVEVAEPLADCIGILSDEDAEEMRRIIEAEFERVRPEKWR
jgi:predicted DNA-binding antitoxin AbrB/MazE fold protein